jgi:hypothetical protein
VNNKLVDLIGVDFMTIGIEIVFIVQWKDEHFRIEEVSLFTLLNQLILRKVVKPWKRFKDGMLYRWLISLKSKAFR